MAHHFQNALVAERFAAYPTKVRTKLMALRTLIFNVAAKTKGVGEIIETLKWNEPAFLAANKNIGTAIRIDWKHATPKQYAMYVSCQTNLIETLRSMFADTLVFSGNRAIVFDLDSRLDRDAVAICIEAALTYHLRKRIEPRTSKPLNAMS
jgi:hypothetical protein